VKTMKILVAEDDPSSRHLLERTLESLGYSVVAAKNGTEAWRLLDRDDAPNLIILDIMMPGIDGIELCRRVRGRKESAYTYIIMLSAKGLKEDIMGGFDAGADDYIVKPFEHEELVARLKVGQRILALEQAVAQLEHDRAVLEMAATLGHEINNPLAVIVPTVEMIRRDLPKDLGDVGGTIIRRLKAIDQAGQRIAEIVARLVHLSQVRTKPYLNDSSMLDLADEYKPTREEGRGKM